MEKVLTLKLKIMRIAMLLTRVKDYNEDNNNGNDDFNVLVLKDDNDNEHNDENNDDLNLNALVLQASNVLKTMMIRMMTTMKTTKVLMMMMTTIKTTKII